MKTIYYNGDIKEEFYKILNDIRKKCKLVNSYWNGDCYVSKYKDENGKIIEYYDDLECGIPYSINFLEEEK